MFELSLNQRRNSLLKKYHEKYRSYYENDYQNDPISASKNISEIINTYVPEFINNNSHKDDEMEKVFNDFWDEISPQLKYDIERKVNQNTNIYNMCNAVKLSGANSVSRTLSTKLGSLWEKIANLSKYVLSPEEEFNITIKGVDAILYHDEKIHYIQIKTQKNTLTGSQTGRSISELEVYDYPLFAACINNNSAWTFPSHEKIKRIAGEEFWDLCDISYDQLLNNISTLVKKAEDLLE